MLKINFEHVKCL